MNNGFKGPIEAEQAKIEERILSRCKKNLDVPDKYLERYLSTSITTGDKFHLEAAVRLKVAFDLYKQVEELKTDNERLEAFLDDEMGDSIASRYQALQEEYEVLKDYCTELEGTIDEIRELTNDIERFR